MTQGPHDIGGLPDGPIDREEHDAALWEMRIDAMLVLLSDDKRRLMRVDELRRGIESLGEAAYNELTYYQRWIASVAALLVEKDVLTQDEIDRRIEQIRARASEPK